MRSLRVRHVPIGVSEGIFLSHAEIIAQVERLNRGISWRAGIRLGDPLGRGCLEAPSDSDERALRVSRPA
jgi:hypothetical protein